MHSIRAMPLAFSFLLVGIAQAAAADDVVNVTASDSTPFAYLLTINSTTAPRYSVILMPGGCGVLDPRRTADSNLSLKAGGNFLIRSRELFADRQPVRGRLGRRHLDAGADRERRSLAGGR